MKKITKILLIVCGICGGVGIILCAAGLLMGASLSQFVNAFSVRVSDFINDSHHAEVSVEEWEAELDHLEPDQWNSLDFDGIKELNISLDAGVVQIEQYDGKDVKVYLKKDDNKTKVNSEGRELVIDYDSSISIFRAHGKSVKVMIPENQVFNEVDIEVGAGEGIIDNIKTTEFDAEVGAGTLRVTGSVQAERSNWDVAAGSLEIANLASKDTKMECAVGEIQATLDGNEEDYSMKGDIGVGALYFGGSAWEGLGQNVEYGNEKAKNTISIECATGEVNIDFEEN